MKMKYLLSIIIPVYNEAGILPHVISGLQNLNCDGKFEIIVVDGNPEQNTIRTICHSSVKTRVSEKGRAVQMNRGADVAEGKILLFLHADTGLPPDAIQHILTVFKKDDVVAGSFDLGIRSNKKRCLSITAIFSSGSSSLNSNPDPMF